LARHNANGQNGRRDKTDIKRKATNILVRISTVTNAHFGSLSPSGALGWHKTWHECYRTRFNLLLADYASIVLFADEELDIVKATAAKPLAHPGNPAPIFHRRIWDGTT